MKLDLHIHTTDSDGTDTPTRVVERAHELGFAAVAITDHDTLGGVTEGMEAGRRVGLRVIPGCEISAGGVSEVHVLGYGLTPGCGIDDMLTEMREERYLRMERMIEKLSEVGVEIDFETVRGYTNGPLGRAHLARALLERGYVESIRDAFSRYLAPGAVAYVPRRKLETRSVIAMIRDCGGVPVVAHPGRSCSDTFWLEECLRAWKKKGLMGVEAYHPAHGLSMARALDRMARRNGLLVTGGSDYHGGIKLQDLGDGLVGWKRMEQDYKALESAIANAARR